jgi:hypothetical protein
MRVTCIGLVATLTACGDSTGPAPAPTGSGTIHATTATNGTQLDDNGYLLSVDAASGQAIGINAAVDVGAVPAGRHRVQLLDVAPTCGVSSANPVTVSVVNAATAVAAFTVICGVPGTLTVTTTTQGLNPFPRTYKIAIDSVDRGTIGPNASIKVSDLALGLHSVRLTVPTGCTFDFFNPKTVSTKPVTLRPAEDANVSFSVICL